MNTEILCVGTELLIGDIVNTNAAFLSRELAAMGIFVYHHTVCGDNTKRLLECLDIAVKRSDLVIMTGGLGPTYDDMTKETVANYFGLTMESDRDSEARIEAFFERIGRSMTENNKKQALMPKGAYIFKNDYGTAPGLAVKSGEKLVILLPGPPREMKPMFVEEVKPFLLEYAGKSVISRNINIFGKGESEVESLLRELMQNSVNPTIAPYVNDGEVRVRLSALAANSEEADKIINPFIEKITDILGDAVYGVDMGSIEHALVLLLSEKNKKIAVCESCTGGLISKRITDISGSSEVFGYGVCSYANEAKIKLLGVNAKTLDEYGAVSEQTAAEMAKGMLLLSGADIAVSTTGIAGPCGGTDETPVGLVYVGISTHEKTVVKKLLLCRGNNKEREYVRSLAASNALKSAFDIIKEI